MAENLCKRPDKFNRNRCQQEISTGKLKYPHSEDRNFNRVGSDISVALRETTLTIINSIDTPISYSRVVVRYSHHTSLQWAK